MSKSINDILNKMISTAKEKFPQLSWAPESPEVDLLIPTLFAFKDAYVLTDYVRLLTRLNGYEELEYNTTIRSSLMETLEITEEQLNELLRNDLDNFVSAYGMGLKRKGGSYAKGSVILVFSNNNPVTIAQGTKFVSALRKIEYTTSEPILSRVPVLYNGQFIIRAFVTCSVLGAIGNITSGSVLLPQIKINNLVRCEVARNINNGEDIETNAEFVARIRSARMSRGVGSRSFLRNLIMSDERVYDVWLNPRYRERSSEFQRPIGVDVWVYAKETPKVVSEITKSNHHILETQPLINDNPIITPNYNLVSTNNYYSRSVEAVDKVVGAIDQRIEYYVDSTIRDLQMLVEDQDYWLLGGRRLVLVKKAKSVKINFRIKLYHVFNSNLDDVKSAVKNNLQYFFSGGTTSYGVVFDRKLLGIDIDKSDLINVILNTENVDRIDLRSFRAVRSDGLSPNVDPIPIANNEYAELGTVIFL